MPFTSKLGKNELIINDETKAAQLRPPAGRKKGLEMARSSTLDYSYGDHAQPYPASKLIPRSEWEARIKEMEERKTRLSDVVRQAGLPCKDQAQTNYCWINAPTHCTEIVQVQQNEPMVILSPASAGAPIKGFRNVGGWGLEGLEYISKYGLVPVEFWPPNAINRSYYTEENKQRALKYRVTEWYECKPRNLDEMVSSLLNREPGASGLNWWSHEVTYYEVVWLDGEVAIRARNSWGMEYGDDGWFILQGNRMMPDDYVVAVVATA